MRRTASSVLRDLDVRIARLERLASQKIELEELYMKKNTRDYHYFFPTIVRSDFVQGFESINGEGAELKLYDMPEFLKDFYHSPVAKNKMESTFRSDAMGAIRRVQRHRERRFSK